MQVQPQLPPNQALLQQLEAAINERRFADSHSLFSELGTAARHQVISPAISLYHRLWRALWRRGIHPINAIDLELSAEELASLPHITYRELFEGIPPHEAAPIRKRWLKQAKQREEAPQRKRHQRVLRKLQLYETLSERMALRRLARRELMKGAPVDTSRTTNYPASREAPVSTTCFLVKEAKQEKEE